MESLASRLMDFASKRFRRHGNRQRQHRAQLGAGRPTSSTRAATPRVSALAMLADQTPSDAGLIHARKKRQPVKGPGRKQPARARRGVPGHALYQRTSPVQGSTIFFRRVREPLARREVDRRQIPFRPRRHSSRRRVAWSRPRPARPLIDDRAIESAGPLKRIDAILRRGVACPSPRRSNRKGAAASCVGICRCRARQAFVRSGGDRHVNACRPYRPPV